MKTNQFIEKNVKEANLVEINAYNTVRNNVEEKHFICLMDNDEVIDKIGFRHITDEGERNLMDMPYVGIPYGELDRALLYVYKNAWKRLEITEIDSYLVTLKAKKYLLSLGYSEEESFISNGALIAALVISGYTIKRSWLEHSDEYSHLVYFASKRDTSIEIKF